MPLTAYVFVIGAPAMLGSAVGQPLALPMAEVEACAIEYANPVAYQGRWGGRIADYDVSTDSVGTVTNLTRRSDKTREHLLQWVRWDQFEGCVRRWKFESQGQYVVSLLGGTTDRDVWTIQITQSDRTFRLRVPVAKAAGTPPPVRRRRLF